MHVLFSAVSRRGCCSKERKRKPLQSLCVNDVDIRKYQHFQANVNKEKDVLDAHVLPKAKPFTSEDLNGTSIFFYFVVNKFL